MSTTATLSPTSSPRSDTTERSRSLRSDDMTPSQRRILSRLHETDTAGFVAKQSLDRFEAYVRRLGQQHAWPAVVVPEDSGFYARRAAKRTDLSRKENDMRAVGRVVKPPVQPRLRDSLRPLPPLPRVALPPLSPHQHFIMRKHWSTSKGLVM